jgi:hypothetical protein
VATAERMRLPPRLLGIGALVLAPLALCAQAPGHVLTGVEGRVYHQKPTSDDWNRIIGSYHVRVCVRDGRCNDDAGTDVLAVLFVAIQIDTISWPMHEREDFMLFIGSAGHESLNACYALERTSPRPSHSFPVVSQVGLFAVRPEPPALDISIALGANVDAFYTADAVIRDGHLEGVGRYSAVPTTKVWPADTVVGDRVGPPTLQPCISLARALGEAVRRGR